MDILLWGLTGALTGWLGLALLRVNADGGLLVALPVGAVGGIGGGLIVAPMFAATGSPASDALLYAAFAASALLLLANYLLARRDV